LKIAVFGGSFDPVHIAHQVIVEVALKDLDIDKLIVVPTYLSPFKSSFYLEPKIRFELLKKVFANFKNVEICDYEIKRDKISYTYDTVSYIKSIYKPSKIYFIIGEDNVRNLHKWYKIEELKRELEFVVATRVGFNRNIKDFKILDIDISISSTNLREQINLDFIPKVIQKDILNLQKDRN